MWSSTRGAPPTVTSVDGIGDQARATIVDGAGWTTTATFAKESGAWKLAGFLGRPAKEFEQIEMVDRDGDPCPDVSDWNHPKVTGGCSFTAAATDVAIRLLTPFGDVELADCSVDYRVSVAPPGHGWIHDVEFGGDQRNRCTEIEPCLTDDGEHRPWQTRIVGDGKGGHLQRVVICLRTPLGSFARHHVIRHHVIRLARENDGWRAEPTNQGDAGFKIDGPLTIAGDPFDIRKPRGPIPVATSRSTATSSRAAATWTSRAPATASPCTPTSHRRSRSLPANGTSKGRLAKTGKAT
jgi:hypothetical protein